MTIVHEIFDVLGFIVALLGLYQMWVKAELSRRFIVVAVAFLLSGLGGVVVYEHIVEQRNLKRVKSQVIELLRSGPETVEELEGGLRVEELPLLKQALDDGELNGDVRSSRYSLSQADGSVSHLVRLYYRPR
jgi:hypothetical protein